MTTNQERPGEDKPLWDSSHPDGQAYIRGSELGDKLTKKLPILKDIVRTVDLWAHLQRYEVLGSADVERCKRVGKFILYSQHFIQPAVSSVQ